ncbi:Ig-like domain-containing protein [Nocardioides houyundeii]|uniref:Ig-like domain-containing protein n=1 Tax=Nocardioides houyundeii TaxID=2045452 RepID=UPI0013B3DD9A|nr:Ig-like domain-containing protein [Nocardioides houyundeii]
MALRGFVRRHRAAIASNTALVIAAGAVLGYAVSADGYRSHRTELNDGGIWVTKSDKGYFGRVNKPIGRLDGAIYLESDADLDVVQDGAAVAGIDRRAGRMVGIDPAGLVLTDGAAAALPDGAQVQMRGGTLASLDPSSGAVWGSRYDPQVGTPLVGAIDQQSDPLAKVGKAAALAVSTSGTVYVVSVDKARLATWHPDGAELADPVTEGLPRAAGEPGALTVVGDTPVSLDAATGALVALQEEGVSATVPTGGVLQQPGPGAADVLVASRGGLTSVDLTTGRTTMLLEDVSGRPAEPVRLGACSYAAWSGGPGYVATICGDDEPVVATLTEDATDLVFRVNRGEVVLNDRASGAVWDLDADEPQKIDNWEAFTSTRKVRDKETEDEQQSQGDTRPPQAKADDFGARAGRTSVLHPLDNDSAPEGRLLAIRGVDKPTMPGAKVGISPDRQTLQISLPADARGVATFEYYIDDGRNLSGHATVSVRVRAADVNAAPTLREGFEPRTWRVPAGGSVEVPVLPDWRDHDDSDPLLLESAKIVSQGESGATARSTNHGRVRFTAPRRGGEVRVDYAVSDGLSAPVTKSLQFAVQDKFEQTTYPAVAAPDVVSGEVGKPIIVRPLANDLPGSDPSTPEAELALGGKIADQAGIRIRTDTNAGVVRVDADKAGTYLLDYQAAYGNAAFARGKIRVDVVQPPPRPEDPVAMPDTLTLYGQAAATVDVLANDVDPAGGILVVQRARADRPDQVDVAIVDGRWLRISARQGQLSSAQVVRYTISNGASSGVSGEVLVTQRPQPEDNTPVTAPDRAVVRAGSVVVHPVLDNDFSPSGDPLQLVGDAVQGAPGQLEVLAPADYKGSAGAAYVSGRVIRYVAPTDVKEREAFSVPYIAQNSTGETAQGRLNVVVVPAGGPNTAPEAPTLEGRMVAGDTLRLRLPGTGVDPDGDSVVITGIASPPGLGRVIGFGANSLEFQAYPDTAGSEEFSYTVMDSRGAAATGTVRVAVVRASAPQPPVAVPDAITTAPGATALLDVLANDQIGAADNVTIELVDPPQGVSLESEIGPVVIEAPEAAGADVVEVVYVLSNGIDESRASATLATIEGYNNPPIVYDAYGSADDSDAVRVNLLASDGERAAAYDPDGAVEDLQVTEVYADPAIYQRKGNVLTVQRGEEPRVVPFRVEDAAGGVASASLFVPATGSGRPYLREGASIDLDAGKTSKHKLGDFIASPTGGAVEIVGQNRIWSSPRTQLTARSTGAQGFEISAKEDYRGPAAVLVEVVPRLEDDGTEDSGSQQPTLITIPVQVGSDKPDLECPATPFEVAQADSISIDIQSVCYVWTADPADLVGLDYTVEWASEASGVSLANDGGPAVRIAAAGEARAGSEARITVRAGKSDPQTLTVQVVRAPSPSLAAIPVPDMRPGTSKEIDLARYLKPGVSDAEPRILGVRRVSGTSVQATSSGSMLRLSSPKGARGRTELSVEMTDVAGDPGPERRVTGRISIEVLDVPSVPGAPQDISVRDRAIRLSWRPSEPQGAPIDYYEVRAVNGGGGTQRFRTNGGDFKVPANGKQYSFQARAHNKVGFSDWSERSRSAVADIAPGRVPWIRQTSRGDKTMTISWGAPRTQTSEILMYYLTWPGGSADVPGDLKSYVVPNLDNNKTYVFSIRARNKADTSEPRVSEPFQSLGTPPTPSGLRHTDQQTGKSSTAVLLQWNAVLPEGPGPTTYSVSARVAGGAPVVLPGCSRIEANSCRQLDVPYDGRTWEYTVQAHNAGGNTSPVSAPVVFEAIGVPSAWGEWSGSATGRDNELALSYSVPEARGALSQVSVLVNGVVIGSWNETGARSRTINVPDNLSAHSVALRLCNENAAKVGCTTSGVKFLQSYGPLTGTHLNAPVVSSVVGKTINFNVAGSGNGRPVRLQVTAVGTNGRYLDTVRDLGPGSFNEGFNLTTSTFEEGVEIVATLTDLGVARGAPSRSLKTGSGTAPPPSISLSRSPCSDADDSTLGGCEPSWWKCDVASCGHLVITTTDMNRAYKCRVTNSLQPNQFWDFDFDTNDNHTTSLAFYEGFVTATCTEKGGNRPPGSTTWGWQ